MIRVLALLACLFIAGCDDDDKGKGEVSIQSITLSDGRVIQARNLLVIPACVGVAAICLALMAMGNREPAS